MFKFPGMSQEKSQARRSSPHAHLARTLDAPSCRRRSVTGPTHRSTPPYTRLIRTSQSRHSLSKTVQVRETLPWHARSATLRLGVERRRAMRTSDGRSHGSPSCCLEGRPPPQGGPQFLTHSDSFPPHVERVRSCAKFFIFLPNITSRYRYCLYRLFMRS